MDSNREEVKKIIYEAISSLQKQILGQRQAVAKAIALQKIMQQQINTKQESNIEEQFKRQTSLVQTLKDNLINLESELSRWQAKYNNWGNDDRPPSGGIAPSPRPRNPSPNPKIDSAAAFPDQ